MIDGSSLPDFDALWDYARPARPRLLFAPCSLRPKLRHRATYPITLNY